MKPIIFFCTFIFFCSIAYSQSSRNINFGNKVTIEKALSTGKTLLGASLGSDNFNIQDLPTFGIYGIGNTNTETFSNINASGKLAGYIRPRKNSDDYWQVDFSFDVNASNTDSALTQTFLFPDVGTRSFYTGFSWNRKLGTCWSSGNNIYFFSPFFEFSLKTIKGSNQDSARTFNTLNYIVGTRLQYMFLNDKDQVSFSIAPYYSIVYVPKQNQIDYDYLFNASAGGVFKSTISSFGGKIIFQYNSFQIFADLKTVIASNGIPSILCGFHPNIGIIFNSDLLEK